MREPILVPDLAAPQVVLSVWYVKPGEKVVPGDRLVELLLGSATFDLASPGGGVLIEQTAMPDEVLAAGQTIGFLEVGDA